MLVYNRPRTDFHRGFPFIRQMNGLTQQLFLTMKNNFLEPQTTIKLLDVWWNSHFYVKDWNHPTETTNKKWLFRVPGLNNLSFFVATYSSSPKSFPNFAIGSVVLKTNFRNFCREFCLLRIRNIRLAWSQTNCTWWRWNGTYIIP